MINGILLSAPASGSLAGHFTWIDWSIVFGYLAFTTVLGGALAGKQATIRDFFLGGRKLPWYAVAGSIVATEISAVTFISVPYVVFKPGGNLTYLQLGVFGSLLARLIVGYVLVPAYYKREIYSPYDYMGNRLGSSVRSMTTALFTLTGLLAQSARVFLTAVVLELILRAPLSSLYEATGIGPMTASIWIIGIVAVAWTIMGGITTVIWTDVILFLCFVFGAAVALATVAFHLEGGLAEVFRIGHQAGKFQFWDFDPSPFKTYTIWTAVIASTWGGVGSYGTDQLLAQRMFCCRSPQQARLAIIASWLGQVVTWMVGLVGVGLFAYYAAHPLSGEALAAYQEKGDRIFPIFILTVVPPGLTGLIIAAIFAAAISSLDSILAAMAQTSISAFYLPWRKKRLQRVAAAQGVAPVPAGGPPSSAGVPDLPEAADLDTPAESRRAVMVSRIFVVFWGIALCVMTHLTEIASRWYPSILDLALAMAGYAGGSLLAGFLLAFLRLRIDGFGFMWSAPLSVLTVFALVWHQPWAQVICWAGGTILLATWIGFAFQRDVPGRIGKTIILCIGIAIMLLVCHFGYADGPVDPATGLPTVMAIAWPWQAPIGSIVAFVWGYLLANRRENSSEAE